MLYVNPLEAHPAFYANLAERKLARTNQAVEEFERYFVYMLLSEMRKTIPKDTLLGGGGQQDLFAEMLDDAFAGEIARSGQWGIGKQIAEQLAARETQAAARAALEAKLLGFARGETAEPIALRPEPRPGFPLAGTGPRGIPLARARGISLEARPRGIRLRGGASSSAALQPINGAGPTSNALAPARSEL